MQKFGHLQKGFGILETMASVAMFGVILAGVAQVYVQNLNLQKRAYKAQMIQENSMYVLERMAREIRMGSITSANADCNVGAFTGRLDLIHPINGNVYYEYSGSEKSIRRSETSVFTGGAQQIENLNSTGVIFENVYFCILGASSGTADSSQARVTIIAYVRSSGPGEVVRVRIQTTVSQREFMPEL